MDYPPYDIVYLTTLAHNAMFQRGEPITALGTYHEIARQRRLQLQGLLDKCPDAEIVSDDHTEMIVDPLPVDEDKP